MAISKLLVAALAAALAPLPAASGADDAPLAVVDADGRILTLDELRSGREATVLVFWSAGCPCVRRYQARVDALLDAYPEDRVRVVALSSNAGETLTDTLRAAAERGVRVPIYRDEGGRVARAVGARSTPTVAILDGKGEVRFLGWLDNERPPGADGREAWLDQALAALLAGRSDFRKRTPTYGCVITRSLSDPASSPCCSAGH
ncbi:MAG TPA: redoxin domain-containing protein [Anaeromyxobacteraceae bacterium]|nr:redoxin domain-containing protein [Anaeromyxobacteraceae bacterium]